MALATQPSALPTNKLTIGILLPLAVQEIGPMMFPQLADAPNTLMLAGAVIALVVAWFVPDRATA